MNDSAVSTLNNDGIMIVALVLIEIAPNGMNFWRNNELRSTCISTSNIAMSFTLL